MLYVSAEFLLAGGYNNITFMPSKNKCALQKVDTADNTTAVSPKLHCKMPKTMRPPDNLKPEGDFSFRKSEEWAVAASESPHVAAIKRPDSFGIKGNFSTKKLHRY